MFVFCDTASSAPSRRINEENGLTRADDLESYIPTLETAVLNRHRAVEFTASQHV